MSVTVRRIVANIQASDPGEVGAFYRDVFGLGTAMDMGWITTLAGPEDAPVQLTVASEGGSGTPLPAISVEVDDLDLALANAKRLGAAVEYGPAVEPWGVRRFFLRDPAGTLVNVLSHEEG